MPSESARMATTAEARYRIDAPNSKPKRVKVIALDRPSEAIVKDLARKAWHGATFFTASSFAAAPAAANFSMQGWLSDLAGRTKSLVDEVDTVRPDHHGTAGVQAVRHGRRPVHGVRPRGAATTRP